MNTTIGEKTGIPRSLPEQKIFDSLRKKRQVLALSLFAFTLCLYNSASHFQFLNYDDPEYVTENSHVQQGLHWRTTAWALTTFEFFNWHPLTWITYMTDYQLYKLNPAGYHFMNVVYHAMGAVLLFLVLHQGTGHLGRSFSVATLFAIHPLNIESVAWIAERKSVLSTIFWLLAICAYRWYTLRPHWKRYLALMACFALGLMSKPMVITLPCVLLLMDIWPLGRVKAVSYQAEEHLHHDLSSVSKRWPALFLEKAPLLLMSAVSVALTLLAQRHNGGLASITKYPITTRIENAIVSYALYVYKTVLPLRLAIFYPHPSHTIPAWKIDLSAIFLLAITVAAVHLRGRRPYLLVGWLWFLGTLTPVIGLIQNGDQAMADRYAYIPLIGIFVMFVWTMADWVQQNRNRKIVSRVLALLLFGVLAVKTHHELQYWHDNVSLFTHAVSVTQNNYVAETNLGEALSNEGRDNEAAPHFLNALRYKPSDPIHHYNYGRSLLFSGKPQEAIEEFNLVLQLGASQSLQARTYHNMGTACVKSGKKQEAKTWYKNAIQRNAEGFKSYLELGLLELEDGNLAAARASLQESVRLQPSDIGYFALGQISERQGRLAEARAAYEKAARISPDFTDFQHSLDAIQKKIELHKSSAEPATPALS